MHHVCFVLSVKVLVRKIASIVWFQYLRSFLKSFSANAFLITSSFDGYFVTYIVLFLIAVQQQQISRKREHSNYLVWNFNYIFNTFFLNIILNCKSYFTFTYQLNFWNSVLISFFIKFIIFLDCVFVA